MTIEQALEIKHNWTSEQARNDLEKLLLRGEQPADEVIALACKALEKQILCPPSKNRHKKASKNEMNRSISLIY